MHCFSAFFKELQKIVFVLVIVYCTGHSLCIVKFQTRILKDFAEKPDYFDLV